MPLAFCALAAVGMGYPLYQVTQMWAWKQIDPDMSIGELMVYVVLSCGAIGAGVFGWLRWLLPGTKESPGRQRLAVGCGAGFVGLLAVIGAATQYMANSPRERVLHQLDSAGAMIVMASPFSVELINCSSEQLEDDTLANVGTIRELRWLSLYQHEFTEEEMLALGGLRALEDLWLCDCRIPRGSTKELSLLSSLSNLNLEWSDVVDEDLEVLQSFPLLEQLSLDGTEIEGRGLRFLAGLENVDKVSLFGCQICGESLAHLVHVRELRLTNTPIRDDDLAYLANSESITDLSLAGTDITDAGLQHLGRIKSLRVLCLHHTKVTGNGLDHLKDLEHLRTLQLGDTPLDDEGLLHLPPLPGFWRLDLERTNVTGKGLNHLATLPRLGMLDLTECDLGDDDVAVFVEHPIWRIDFDGTRVTEGTRSRIRDAWSDLVSERLGRSDGE